SLPSTSTNLKKKVSEVLPKQTTVQRDKSESRGMLQSLRSFKLCFCCQSFRCTEKRPRYRVTRPPLKKVEHLLELGVSSELSSLCGGSSAPLDTCPPEPRLHSILKQPKQTHQQLLHQRLQDYEPSHSRVRRENYELLRRAASEE